jgi:hypothetical protein
VCVCVRESACVCVGRGGGVCVCTCVSSVPVACLHSDQVDETGDWGMACAQHTGFYPSPLCQYFLNPSSTEPH